MLKTLVLKVVLATLSVIKHLLFVVIYGVLCMVALYVAHTIYSWYIEDVFVS